LLRYGHGNGVWNRRQHFTKLVADATEAEDIELLADILSIILRKPWETNLEGGCFIHRLRKKENIDEFDADRAAHVLNTLYDIQPLATKVLILTLKNFVDTYENMLRLLDLLSNTGKLRREIVLMMEPPNVFISYAHEDNEKVEMLYADLQNRGFKVWKDNHELLPGEKWELKIKRTLKEYEFIIVCLSRISVSKRGFFQAELKMADRKQIERPSSDVCIIPIKLDDFNNRELPEEVEGLHYVDLSKNWTNGLTAISNSTLKYRR